MDKRNNNNVNLNPQYNQYNQYDQYDSKLPYQDDNIEDVLYPEIYKKLSPIVDQLISDMERQYGNIDVTDDLLNSMADEVLRRSQMTDYTEPEAMPMVNNLRGFNPNHNNPGHNRNSISDIIKIILLQQLFGGRRRPRWRRGRR